MNEKYIQSLRDAIQKKHGCISRYAQTVAVKDEREGKVVWEGKVEVFDLAGHAKAAQCFAWGYKDEEGRWQYVTVLKVAPVDSALKAVVAFNNSR
ncbi:MAG TPA: hypothetical protein VM008_18215 [Phycisphaerae bacterium]|nr:hypothetical protein [Phycisphaerae bacterium]